ncbi:type I restriction enzyme, S subunit [Bradyrhizobium lablabi]|uniref:Type I restriction enzyme, S subunit n=1 Tax=Bradyrhizobium lablabi TaxID=722472 RepID=A0A1M6TXF6_9BRAD|nr:restriction endonuclease subunit S [Bradyrhizobium lablabi]SHK61619.1 type I restriction enzyme, S subunit [Bradyrhizobium lablabi]
MTFRTARLSEICDINPKIPKSLDDSALASFLPMAAVSEEGRIAFEEERTVAEVKKGYTYFERGDVLVAKITPCFENGKASRTFSLSKPFGFGSTEFHVLRVANDVLPDFLFYKIWNSSFRELGAQNMTGSAGQKRVPADFLKRLEIRLPPLEEQRRIAAILDKADALRRKRKSALDLLENTKNSFVEFALRKASSGKTEALGEYLDFITSGGRNWSKYYSPEGSRFIRSLDVQMNSISHEDPVYVAAPENAEARRTRTHKGDVLLTVTGSRIGRVAELPADLIGSYVSQHVAILRPTLAKLRPKFLSFFLSSREGQRQIQKWQYGQTKPGLNFKQIEGFLIPKISVNQQVRFEEIAERFEGSLSVQRDHCRRLTSLFSSLQSRAFSGQL